MIKLKRNYTLLIGIRMIGNSNYIVTSLSGLIQEVKSKEKYLIHFLQGDFILMKILERLIGSTIHY